MFCNIKLVTFWSLKMYIPDVTVCYFLEFEANNINNVNLNPIQRFSTSVKAPINHNALWSHIFHCWYWWWQVLFLNIKHWHSIIQASYRWCPSPITFLGFPSLEYWHVLVALVKIFICSDFLCKYMYLILIHHGINQSV